MDRWTGEEKERVYHDVCICISVYRLPSHYTYIHMRRSMYFYRYTSCAVLHHMGAQKDSDSDDEHCESSPV